MSSKPVYQDFRAVNHLLRWVNSKLQEFFRSFRTDCYFSEFRPLTTASKRALRPRRHTDSFDHSTNFHASKTLSPACDVEWHRENHE